MGPLVTELPRTRRWTAGEYDCLIELGVFRPGERLELLDGLLVVREPQGSRHASAIRRVIAALRDALGGVWQIDSQLPRALGAESEPDRDTRRERDRQLRIELPHRHAIGRAHAGTPVTSAAP